jgi:hypothetical protein
VRLDPRLMMKDVVISERADGWVVEIGILLRRDVSEGSFRGDLVVLYAEILCMSLLVVCAYGAFMGVASS